MCICYNSCCLEYAYLNNELNSTHNAQIVGHSKLQYQLNYAHLI